MFPRLWRFAAVLAAVAALSACEFVDFVPFDPVIAGNVTAQDSTSPTKRLDGVLAPGETLYYRVSVPSPRDLLYGEAVGTNLRVRWLTAGGLQLAASQSPTYFARTVSALAEGAAELDAAELDTDVSEAGAVDPQSIDVSYSCLGPCAAIAPVSGTYILAVENRGNTTTSFELYAYTFLANDLADRGAASNDSSATAVPFSSTGFLTGAIELVGDVDWFSYTGVTQRTIRFTNVNASLGLRLRFQDGTTLSGAPGDQTTQLLSGDRFWVESVLDRAGPSATSRYTVEVF